MGTANEVNSFTESGDGGVRVVKLRGHNCRREKFQVKKE